MKTFSFESTSGITCCDFNSNKKVQIIRAEVIGLELKFDKIKLKLHFGLGRRGGFPGIWELVSQKRYPK